MIAFSVTSAPKTGDCDEQANTFSGVSRLTDEFGSMP